MAIISHLRAPTMAVRRDPQRHHNLVIPLQMLMHPRDPTINTRRMTATGEDTMGMATMEVIQIEAMTMVISTQLMEAQDVEGPAEVIPHQIKDTRPNNKTIMTTRDHQEAVVTRNTKVEMVDQIEGVYPTRVVNHL